MAGAALWAVLGVGVGCMAAVQAAVNAGLARALGSPIAAAAISFLVGASLLSLAALAVVRSDGVLAAWRVTPAWWFFVGGCLGACFVTAMIVMTPRLGTGAVMALAVAGQLIAGLAIDHFGWFGLEMREASLGRLAGALLLVGGAALMSFL